MGRRKDPRNFRPLNECPKHHSGDIYWQSAQYNTAVYLMWRNQLANLALSRFKWHHLPPTCDERYLELTLLTQGVATIAHPRRGKYAGQLFSTQAVLSGQPNVYMNPSRWESFGNNGWRFPCDWGNGVLVWDSMTRYPTMQTVDVFAREIADLFRTKQVNRLHQKVPYIIKAPQTKKRDAASIYKQISGNEPAILAYDDGQPFPVEVDAISTQVPYLGKELQADITNTLSLFFQMLGIPNLPFKTERRIEDEVTDQGAPTEVSLLSPLGERRKAAKLLNHRFGHLLEKPIEVTFNQDLKTESYNLMHSLAAQVDAADGLAQLMGTEGEEPW